MIKIKNKPMERLKKIIFLLLFSLVVSGCTQDTCIDADDFGFLKFTISARSDETLMGNASVATSIAMFWVDEQRRKK